MKSLIRIVIVLCAITAQFALSGCGSGGSGGSQNAGVTTTNAISTPDSSETSYSLADDFGFMPADLMATENSRNNAGGFVLRVSNTKEKTSDNSGDIFRIDFQNPSLISVNGGTYSIGNNNEYPPFPGEISFFNCSNSGYLKTTSGTISFSSYGPNSGDLVVGSFDVQVENNDPNAPKKTYSIQGNFSFVVNSSIPISGPILTPTITF
jgi:hypothetical protein